MSEYPAAIVAAVAARGSLPAPQAAVEVNDLVLAVKQPIGAAAVRKLWSKGGVLARAWVVANDQNASFASRWHCKAAYDAISHGFFADFDTQSPAQLGEMQVYFTRLKEAGPDGDRVLTDGIIAATLALADVQMTGAELMGRRLDESDIINIRAELV
jgi:hypothetical protein